MKRLLYICSKKRLIAYLKRKLSSDPQKIYYFFDRAASQYKNHKNFINLCHHEEDFGVCAELQLLMAKVLVMDLMPLLNALLQELACEDHMTNK